ncbi:hypothetical protein DFJ74DRAFT_706345 [Hyaloraphidium curvatum]|nr:hypothetical protein DFJ74DRAFT_706345 [Hyaloraphidium curvatum]
MAPEEGVELHLEQGWQPLGFDMLTIAACNAQAESLMDLYRLARRDLRSLRLRFPPGDPVRDEIAGHEVLLARAPRSVTGG